MSQRPLTERITRHPAFRPVTGILMLALMVNLVFLAWTATAWALAVVPLLLLNAIQIGPSVEARRVLERRGWLDRLGVFALALMVALVPAATAALVRMQLDGAEREGALMVETALVIAGVAVAVAVALGMRGGAPRAS